MTGARNCPNYLVVRRQIPVLEAMRLSRAVAAPTPAARPHHCLLTHGSRQNSGISRRACYVLSFTVILRQSENGGTLCAPRERRFLAVLHWSCWCGAGPGKAALLLRPLSVRPLQHVQQSDEKAVRFRILPRHGYSRTSSNETCQGSSSPHPWRRRCC